jgi:hypothetical protein
VVLLRDPLDAVTSMMQRSPALSPRDLLQSYSRFYERLLPLLDHVIVASFDVVTLDFGSVISDVNLRFGTNFLPYEPTPANEERVRSGVEWSDLVHNRGRVREHTVSRPSIKRNSRRSPMRNTIADDCANELAKARSTYLRVLRATSSL